MDPDPWELWAAPWLALLAYCLFQMLWAKLNVVLLCLAMAIIHLVFLYFSIMVGFFYLLWNRRLQSGRHLIQFLSHKFPTEKLLPTYQAVWENVYVGRTWFLGILCLVLNLARRNSQRMLEQLRNEMGKALCQAAVWSQCSISVACQHAHQVILRAVLIQFISTLLLGYSERLWSNISQGTETIRAFQLGNQSSQQHQHSGSSANKEMTEAPNYIFVGSRARLSQHIRRSNLRGQSSICQSPTPSTSTGRGECHCFAPIFPLNTRPQEGKKKMDKKTKRKNEEEKLKKGEREKKAEEKKQKKEKKEKKVEKKKEIKDDGKKVKVKVEGGKVREQEDAKKKIAVKGGGRKVREEEVAKKKMEGKKNVEEKRGEKVVEEEKVQKPEEKMGDKGKKEETERENKVEKKETKKNRTSESQQDMYGYMKSLCEFISFVYLYAMYIFMQ